MLNIVIIFAFGYVLGDHIVNAGHCSPCRHTLRHYYEFGCEGIQVTPMSCCPDKYLCPDLTKLDPSKCYYNGKSYEVGENITATETPLCFNSCTCKRTENETSFNCNISKEAPLEGEQNCVRQYEPNVCRHVNTVCADNINKLDKCFWRGKSFFEGERFSTDSDPCFSCHCNKHFNNTISISDNKSSCSMKNCGLALQHFNKFRWGCVPVYNKFEACCPTEEWICPTTQRVQTDRDDMACRFGSQIIERWKKLDTKDNCLICECSTPPELTCIRTPNCA